jgi:hypothetical protein
LRLKAVAVSDVSDRSLSRIEQAILDILEFYPNQELLGQDLRGLLQRCGFRRSAPAFVFTMMRLADKGLVVCREEVIVIRGLTVRDRFYTLCRNARDVESFG